MATGDEHFPGDIRMVAASASTFNASQTELVLNAKPAWAKYVRMTVEFESDSALVFDYDLAKSGMSQGATQQRDAGSQHDVNEVKVTISNAASPELTWDEVGYYERDNVTWNSLTGLATVIISNIKYLG